MSETSIHQCQCPNCVQEADHPDKELHRQIQEQMADRFGLEVMVCHYPAGASKWNPVEHRLFSHISINWAGKPLRSFEIMLDYIRGTTTETGLAVKAFLVKRKYKTGVKVSNQAMKTCNRSRG